MWRWVLSVVVAAALSPRAASAATLLVANNGVDSPTCGPAEPCRSLARAIANAVAGDTIVVGPGRYGDLNGDGTLGNAAGEGAKIALLSYREREAADAMPGRVEYIELSGREDFNDIFLAVLGFPALEELR